LWGVGKRCRQADKKRVSSTQPKTKRKDALRRKTKEEVKGKLRELAEETVEEWLGHIEQRKEGDLDQLEQRVLEVGSKALEEMLRQKARKEEAAQAPEGSCGQTRRLVRYRDKQVNTLMRFLTIRRASSQCQEPKHLPTSEIALPACPGVAPCDQRWGLDGQRSSPGVRRRMRLLSARLTQEDVAETVTRLLPLSTSARPVGNVTPPIGEACVQREDQQVQKLLAPGANTHRRGEEQQEEHGEPIRRLSLERDGVMARLRRGKHGKQQPRERCLGT